jgi:hypothetical protein
MKTLTLRTLAAALAIIPMIVFSADTPLPNLNVRMGLWETTVTSSGMGDAIMAGMDDAMKNMTPEQKARMAVAMSRMQQHEAVPHANTSHSCMTPEKMKRDAMMSDKNMAGHCTHTVTENTATTMAVHFTCSENGVTNEGDGRFTALSPTSVKGSMDMHMVMHGKPVNMHSDFQSKWISADCGAEK